MGGFSCFTCLGGKNGRRLQSSEPVRQAQVPAQGKKTASLPRNVSSGPEIIREGSTIASDSKRQEDPEKAVSSTIPEPDPLAMFTFEDSEPPTAASVSQKDIYICDRTEEQQSSFSSSTPNSAASQPPQNIPQAIRAVSPASSRSQSSNLGSSLGNTCTEATTPPRTPTETEAKTTPGPQKGENDPISPIKEEYQQRKQDDTTSLSPQVEAPPSEKSRPRRSQSILQSDDLKALEASKSPLAHTTTTLPGLETNPTDLNTSKDLRSGRPSYENDTPITPSAPTSTTTTPTTFSRPSLLRLSTAPASIQDTTKTNEKRKSRLSRFLSLSATNKDGKPPRKSLQVTEEEGGVEGGPVDIPSVLAEVEGDGDERSHGLDQERGGAKKGGEDDPVGEKAASTAGGQQSSWQREMQAKEAGLGRKWAEGGDNESLFCY